MACSLCLRLIRGSFCVSLILLGLFFIVSWLSSAVVVVGADFFLSNPQRWSSLISSQQSIQCRRLKYTSWSWHKDIRHARSGAAISFYMSVQDKEQSQKQAGETEKEFILEESRNDRHVSVTRSGVSFPSSQPEWFDWIKINMTRGAAAHLEQNRGRESRSARQVRQAQLA